MTWRAILMACLVAGCGSDREEPASEPEPSTESESEPEPEPEQAPEQDEAPEVMNPLELDRTARAELRELRRQARRASAAGEHGSAWTLFARAIERAPLSAQLRCEGGSAARRAGRMDQAARELDHGLTLIGPLESVPAGLRVTAAQCLYDRGRVHEEREEDADARRAYEASLALRDNAIVRERLAGLDDAAEDEPDVAQVETVAELVEHVRELGCEDADETPEVEVLQQLEEPAAAWLKSTCRLGQYGILSVSHLLARRVEGGWELDEPYRLVDGGRQYLLSRVLAEDVSVLQDLRRGDSRAIAVRTHIRTEEGQEELVLFSPDDDDVECLSTEMTMLDRRALILCMDGCRSLTLGRETSQESSLVCTRAEGDELRDVEPPAWARGDAPPESEAASRWSISLRFDDRGRAQISVRDGEPPAEIRRLARRPLTLPQLFDAMTPLSDIGDYAW